MKKQTRPPAGSFAPAAITPARLPTRRRWDQRYATLDPTARLTPTPFISNCLPKLPVQGWALDVAAGAGRHAIALAQRGLQVDAVDISWHGLRLARQRALSAGLTLGQQINLVVADIERPWLPQRRYEVVIVSFFLHRPLLPIIKERLRPGGWLVYETFTVDQPLAPNKRPIRPDLLLQPGELKAAFADFDILFYAEGEHHNRATARLLARKSIGNA